MHVESLFPQRRLILEAGVKTAAVDRAARTAIIEHLDEIVKAIENEALPTIGSYERDEDNENVHDYYQRLYDWYGENREQVVKTICAKLSEILTKVVRDIVDERDLGIKIDRNIQVILEPREYSEDEYKHVGGYQDGFSNRIKVFVSGSRVRDAALGVVHQELFGEDSEGEATKFINAVVPTFVHEYTHFEQQLKRGMLRYNDLSHVTLGSKRVRATDTRPQQKKEPDEGKPKKLKRRGKRGGLHRDSDTPEEYLRYMGSTHEIDAWASGAASELVQEIERYKSWSSGDADFNKGIADLRANIANGWATDSSSYKNYFEHYYDSLQGQYPGLDHAQMAKVWKIFLRSLDSKLLDYLRPTIGKTSQYTGSNLDKTWLSFAQKRTMPQAIALIARGVGTKLRWDQRHYDDPENIQREIDRGYGGGYEGQQHKAEEFIRHYYFGNEWYDKEAMLDKTIAVFRKMLKKAVSEADFAAKYKDVSRQEDRN